MTNFDEYDINKICGNDRSYAKKFINREIEDEERDYAVDRLNEYCDLYEEKSSHSSADIYRMIEIPKNESYDCDNIGIWWSFEDDGVGTYGSTNFIYEEPSKNIIFKGEVEVNDIDWISGLYSYIYYPSQKECNVKLNSLINLISINDEELEEPRECNSGKYQTYKHKRSD